MNYLCLKYEFEEFFMKSKQSPPMIPFVKNKMLFLIVFMVVVEDFPIWVNYKNI